MIQIDDTDLPIHAAEKIISGTADTNSDMFDLEEIKEIADHLMVYYLAHVKKD